MAIKTAGDLRGFLADVLVGIRNGSIDAEEASAIAKISAQINQSLSVEVKTALELQRMGKDHPAAGSMLIANGTGQIETKVFCDQCDKIVSQDHINACTSKFCKVK